MSFSKACEKDKAKSGDKSKSDFNYYSNHRFYKFFKGNHEFEEVSLDSKYHRIKEFNKRLTDFKDLRLKNPKTQRKKEWIMKNINLLYEKYYDAYKNDNDAHDELNEAKN